jgi:hypothetical protein
MRTRGMNKLVMSAGLMVVLSGTSLALADVPAALDRVPSGSQIVIAVRDMDTLALKMRGMAEQVGMPMPPEADEGMNGFLKAPHLNAKGSMAVVMSLPEGMGEPDFTIILPVTDAKAFISSMGGTGDGVSEIQISFIGGQPGFAKDIGGGYIAMGKTKESVEKFEGKAGSKAAHAKSLGATGNRIADSADMILIANFTTMKTQMEQGVQEMKDSMEGMAQMMPAESADQFGAMLKLVTSVTDAVLKDGQCGIIGLGLDAKGVNLDIAANFKEGSESAGKFQVAGGAAALTAGLPAGDFLFAGSVDWSSPTARSMFATMNEVNKSSPVGAIADMSRFINVSSGYAGFVGAADLGAGLLANTAVVYSSKEPQKLMAEIKTMVTASNGLNEGGMKITSEYAEGTKTIGGLKASTYSMLFEMDENNPAAGQMQMVMPMFFGPEGKMQGYTVATEKSVIMTMSRNSALVEKLINAGKNGFGSDAMVKQTAQRLPADRFMEVYIGIKSVMDMAQGVMAMMGGGAEIKMPESLPPVGMGASMSGGGMQFRVHVPADVIKAAIDVSKQFQGGGDDAMEPAPMGGDEKPRF